MNHFDQAILTQLEKVEKISPCKFWIESYSKGLRRCLVTAQSKQNDSKLFIVFLGVEYAQFIPNWEDGSFNLLLGNEREQFLDQIDINEGEKTLRVLKAKTQHKPVYIVCSIVQVVKNMPKDYSYQEDSSI